MMHHFLLSWWECTHRTPWPWFIMGDVGQSESQAHTGKWAYKAWNYNSDEALQCPFRATRVSQAECLRRCTELMYFLDDMVLPLPGQLHALSRLWQMDLDCLSRREVVSSLCHHSLAPGRLSVTRDLQPGFHQQT